MCQRWSSRSAIRCACSAGTKTSSVTVYPVSSGCVLGMAPPVVGGYQAALAPLPEVRALGAQRGVLAVPGVDPRVVRQDGEEPLLDVVDEAGEPLRVLLGVADPAGKEAVAGEHVRAGALAAAPDQRDAARRVPAQVHDLERLAAD